MCTWPATSPALRSRSAIFGTVELLEGMDEVDGLGVLLSYMLPKMYEKV